MGDKSRGLYGKFHIHIERTDGKSAPGENLAWRSPWFLAQT